MSGRLSDMMTSPRRPSLAEMLGKTTKEAGTNELGDRRAVAAARGKEPAIPTLVESQTPAQPSQKKTYQGETRSYVSAATSTNTSRIHRKKQKEQERAPVTLEEVPAWTTRIVAAINSAEDWHDRNRKKEDSLRMPWKYRDQISARKEAVLTAKSQGLYKKWLQERAVRGETGPPELDELDFEGPTRASKTRSIDALQLAGLTPRKPGSVHFLQSMLSTPRDAEPATLIPQQPLTHRNHHRAPESKKPPPSKKRRFRPRKPKVKEDEQIWGDILYLDELLARQNRERQQQSLHARKPFHLVCSSVRDRNAESEQEPLPKSARLQQTEAPSPPRAIPHDYSNTLAYTSKSPSNRAYSNTLEYISPPDQAPSPISVTSGTLTSTSLPYVALKSPRANGNSASSSLKHVKLEVEEDFTDLVAQEFEAFADSLRTTLPSNFVVPKSREQHPGAAPTLPVRMQLDRKLTKKEARTEEQMVSTIAWLKLHHSNWKQKVEKAHQERCQMVFTILDEDGSGTVELAEVTNAMEAMGMNVSKESLAYLTSHCKEEKGSMTFEEFMDCYSGKDIWKGLEAIQGVASGNGDVHSEHDDKPKHNVDLPLFLWAPAYQRMKQFNWIMKIEARERSGAKEQEEVTLSSRRLRKETFWGERQAHSMALRKKTEYKRQVAAMESINRQPMKRRHPKYTKPQTAEKPLETGAGHSSDSDHTSEGEKDDSSETGGAEGGEIGEVGEVGDFKPEVEAETSEVAPTPKSKFKLRSAIQKVTEEIEREENDLSVHQRNVLESIDIRSQLEKFSLSDIWMNTRGRVLLSHTTSGATEKLLNHQHHIELKKLRKELREPVKMWHDAENASAGKHDELTALVEEPEAREEDHGQFHAVESDDHDHYDQTAVDSEAREEDHRQFLAEHSDDHEDYLTALVEESEFRRNSLQEDYG